MKLKNYQPGNKKNWQGRTDSTSDHSQFRWHQVIECVDVYEHTQNLAGVVLLGFPSDCGIARNSGRTGAALGPQALRQALSGLPAHHDIHLFDAGDLSLMADDLEGAQNNLAEIVTTLLKKNALPVILGGGHDVAYGHGLGVLDFLKSKNQRLGIINFDAHFDLREPENGQGTSGTPFLQLARHCQNNDQEFHYLPIGVKLSSNTKKLFATASHLGVKHITREKIADDLNAVHDQIKNFADNVDAIYLTVCLDVFDASHAPGVSAPQAYGLTPLEFFPMLSTVLKTKKVIAMDIAELSPKHDIDNRTAKLAALILWQVVMDK